MSRANSAERRLSNARTRRPANPSWDMSNPGALYILADRPDAMTNDNSSDRITGSTGAAFTTKTRRRKGSRRFRSRRDFPLTERLRHFFAFSRFRGEKG